MEESFYKEIEKELTEDILPYWQRYSRDEATKGFYGAIDNQNMPDAREERGVVMVSRFLWTYSSAARLLKNASLLDMADYAYSYLESHFADREFGGVFWSVLPDGKAFDDRKQIYGNAFAIYGLSEYAAALLEIAENPDKARLAMTFALEIFSLLEQYAYDKTYGGYAEALFRSWQKTEHSRLSEKDIDCAKSMNTNLHVMEAYTNLWRTMSLVFPEKAEISGRIKIALKNLILTHLERILNQDFHLKLYFAEDWTRIGSEEISYGHDIEASWLLWEACTELGDNQLCEKVKPVVLKIAETALREGFDCKTGGFENTNLKGNQDSSRIWWNQAEAINGFYNAWLISGEEKYALAVQKVWRWICDFQRDKKNGEWFWEVSKLGEPNLKIVKGGNWKTSYHNARCCMEILRRR